MRGSRLVLLVATLLWAAHLTTALATRPPIPIDETRYLTVAWEMWTRGDLLVPRLNAAPYSHKPPLVLWAIQGAWALAGVGEAAARVAPALFALAALWLAAWLGALLWPGRAGLPGRAALMLAGTLAFALFGTAVMFDAALAASALLGLCGVALAWRRKDPRGWALFGLGLGAGLLAKGPVAFLHLLPAPLLAPLWQRERRASTWAGWYGGVAAGFALGAAIALAWALPAAAAGGPGYRAAILWGQTAGRVVDSFAHARPAWYYLAALPLAAYPWALWPPLWRAARRVPRGAVDDGLRLCLVWLAAALAGLSAVSGKQPHYLVPLLPAAALAAARVLADAPAEGRTADVLLPAAVPVALGLAWMALPDLVAVGDGLARYPVAQEWLARLDPWAGVALVVGSVGIALATARRLDGALLGVALGSTLLFLVGHLEGARVAFARYDLGELARRAGAHEDSGLAVVGAYYGEMGFLGRLRRPVDVVEPRDVAAWRERHPAGRLVLRSRGARSLTGLAPEFEQPYRGGRIALLAPAAAR